MKKSFCTMITLTLLFTLLIPIFSSSFVEARTIDQPQPITNDPKKPWTITFNDAVESDEKNLNRIYVQSADNKKLEISIKVSTDFKKVIVIPENHYLLKENYTLFIPKGFKSANGQELTEDTTMPFKIEGKYIEEITANYNQLATNIIVTGTDDIEKVAVSVNKEQAVDFNRSGPGTYFSKGFPGLMKGDQLTVHVYDQKNILLETQYAVVK